MYDELVDRVAAHARTRSRTLLGLTGTPGAGKSTIAQALVEGARERGITAAWVPMDGYHLADVALQALGILERKGALETFDGHGYVALLRRLRQPEEPVVYAPAFDRTLEQPIAGSIAVERDVQLVVTEGNYLLSGVAPWHLVRELLHEVWFVGVDADERRRRLVERHVRFGKSPDAARAWVHDVDEANATAIDQSRNLADVVVTHDGHGVSVVEQTSDRA